MTDPLTYPPEIVIEGKTEFPPEDVPLAEAGISPDFPFELIAAVIELAADVLSNPN